MTDGLREHKRYFFYRDQLVAVGIAFAITSLAIFVLGVIAGRHIERANRAENAASVTRIPLNTAPADVDVAPEEQGGAPAYAGNPVTEPAPEAPSEKEPPALKTQQRSAKAERAQPPPVIDAGKRPPEPLPAKSAKEKVPPLPGQDERQTEPAAKKEPAAQMWTVQVKSSPEKKFADTWANRLKAKGYEAFVIAGDVNGQTWYRVRVGRFTGRQEAETLRDTLETKDGLKGSFVTKTKTAESEPAGEQSEQH